MEQVKARAGLSFAQLFESRCRDVIWGAETRATARKTCLDRNAIIISHEYTMKRMRPRPGRSGETAMRPTSACNKVVVIEEDPHDRASAESLLLSRGFRVRS